MPEPLGGSADLALTFRKGAKAVTPENASGNYLHGRSVATHDGATFLIFMAYMA
ncbi:hypothetical protein [Halomonas sp. SBBP1]|uniref:hypothetical protein n=1 Tax=unclassified Halomonas TaxID=2609666 RepID=UPI0039A733C1